MFSSGVSLEPSLGRRVEFSRASWGPEGARKAVTSRGQRARVHRLELRVGCVSVAARVWGLCGQQGGALFLRAGSSVNAVPWVHLLTQPRWAPFPCLFFT